MSYIDFLIRISVCFVLGVLIGFERQCRRKIAGVRTITLVSLGSFLFVSISNLSPAGDITRIAAQVVSGIGFLGAGIILRDGTNVRGLNTAATLWCSAAIGALTALGLVVEATIGVAYILMANILLRFISRKLLKKTIHTKIINYSLTILCDAGKEDTIKNNLMQRLKFQQAIIKSFSTKKVENRVELELQLKIESVFAENIGAVINKLCVEPGVVSVKYSESASYIDDDDDDFEDK